MAQAPERVAGAVPRPRWSEELEREASPIAAGHLAEAPLRYAKIGDSVRFCVSLAELDEHPPADMCARAFLDWVARLFPEFVMEWITARDIEVHLYPRFVAEGGGTRSFLSLARGLRKVTKKRDVGYVDLDGKRRMRIEYLVPDPQASVVEFAHERRKQRVAESPG